MPAPPLIPPAASDLTPTYHYEKVADSDTSPLGDPKANSSKSLFFGPRKYIGLAALLPFVTVMLWSWGMGTILLTWLLVKRIPPPQGGSSHIFDGYLVVDEGNKTAAVETLDGQETLESAMRGVLIITAISHLSSMMILPLMALGAFHVASKWLDDQAQSKDGPTPLQYGLVMQMCSSGTWNSVLSERITPDVSYTLNCGYRSTFTRLCNSDGSSA
ncbi:hypothetical protein FRC02_005163 [Tulasnella sp. 418]|nr:hypothetical protein FRC02_005163 [Tulasnella sp. 418]